MTRAPSHWFGTLTIKDLIAVGGLIVAATLSFEALRSDSSAAVAGLRQDVHDKLSGVERQLADIVHRLDSQEARDREWLQRVTMELWIERARQVSSFKELPPLPTY